MNRFYLIEKFVKVIDEHGKSKGNLIPADPLIACIMTKGRITFFTDWISSKIYFHITEA